MPLERGLTSIVEAGPSDVRVAMNETRKASGSRESVMRQLAGRILWVAALLVAAASAIANGEAPAGSLAQRLAGAAAGQTGAAQTATQLADEIGARLTWSPNLDRADTWVATRLSRAGLSNIHREAIEQRGLAWQGGVVWLRMVRPDSMMFFAEPAPWSASSHGEQSAQAVLFDPHSIADLAHYRGQLTGKAVLYGAARQPAANATAFVERLNDERAIQAGLAALRFYYAHRLQRLARFGKEADLADAVAAFLIREHPKVVITEGYSMPDGGDSGLIAGDEPPVPARGEAWRLGHRFALPILYTVPEQYNRAARLAERGVPIRLQWRVDTIDLGERPAYNLIGDIAGSGVAERPQMVLVGAHLDSWINATGATDDGAGVGALLEAARLLKTIHYLPKRTIRFVFYAGEEEGGLGAQSYADTHIGTVPRSDTSEQRAVPVESWRLPIGPPVRGADFGNISAVFEIDNGSGKVRGVFTGGNDPALAAKLKEWVAPLRSSGVVDVLDEPDWPADQWTYSGLGLPAITFLQDPLDYDTRTHHTSLDTPDHLSGEDLEQVSVTLAYLIARLGDDDGLAPRPFRAPQ